MRQVVSFSMNVFCYTFVSLTEALPGFHPPEPQETLSKWLWHVKLVECPCEVLGCKQVAPYSSFVPMKAKHKISPPCASVQPNTQQGATEHQHIPPTPPQHCCLVEGGGSAHSLVIKVLVMSHEEGVGEGWDGEIKRKKQQREWEKGRGGGGGGVDGVGSAYITSRCPLTLPGGWQISTVWPWICLFWAVLPGPPACPFIYSTHPFRTCTSALHSRRGVSAAEVPGI